MTPVLGMHAVFHDPAAALVVDGIGPSAAPEVTPDLVTAADRLGGSST